MCNDRRDMMSPAIWRDMRSGIHVDIGLSRARWSRPYVQDKQGMWEVRGETALVEVLVLWIKQQRKRKTALAVQVNGKEKTGHW